MHESNQAARAGPANVCHGQPGCPAWPNWGINFQGWLYTPVNGLPPGPSIPPETVYAGGLLWPYVKVVKVYWCPVDNTNSQYFPDRLEQLSSYIMNGAIMGYYRSPQAVKTHKLASMNPSAYATWEPSDNPPYNPGAGLQRRRQLSQ